jgi:hypothetical protein
MSIGSVLKFTTTPREFGLTLAVEQTKPWMMTIVLAVTAIFHPVFHLSPPGSSALSDFYYLNTLKNSIWLDFESFMPPKAWLSILEPSLRARSQ